MTDVHDDVWLAGVDGCPGGWIVALARADGEAVRPRVVASFADIARAPERPAVIAVDVPIGLPRHSPAKGRLAESAVRRLLGDRKSSVFRIPSRRAVEVAVAAEPADPRERFLHACDIARKTSDDHKAFAKQSFYILGKIVEVDAYLRGNPSDIGRVFETHPEVVFWRINGEQPLDEPKKVKNRPWPKGLAFRRDLLRQAGIPDTALAAAAPEGAAEDDLVDALACLVTARRIHRGLVTSYPQYPPRDEYGLPMAIWA